jgi:chromate reductase, NAD(P)H dehydrogenase (quinone)
MSKVNIAVVVGSNRRDSINRRLTQAPTRLAADKLTGTFVQIDDLPIYNQDLESPLPKSVARHALLEAFANRVADFARRMHTRERPIAA